MDCDKFIPGIKFGDSDRANVIYLGANYDVTSSGGKGADNGPAAVRECLETQIEPLERIMRLDLQEAGYSVAWVGMEDLNNLSPESMVSLVKALYATLIDVALRPFVVVIGGDHSVPIGVFQRLAEIDTPREITIVQVDAHLDLRDTDEFRVKPYGKLAHCCVMRRAAELGFKIVSIGIRDYSREEYDTANRYEVRVFEWGRSVIRPSINQILRAIPTKRVYFSVDLDGLDPSILPATGTPVPGGLTWEEMMELSIGVFSEHEVVGCDIVELAVTDPERDRPSIIAASKLAWLFPSLKFAPR